jgi:hypothetical protein
MQLHNRIASKVINGRLVREFPGLGMGRRELSVHIVVRANIYEKDRTGFQCEDKSVLAGNTDGEERGEIAVC